MPLNLYDEEFQAVMSREERLNYHDVPGNLTPDVAPYVERLRAADAIVFVHPVWNYGYPAILKGYFDRIFLPGVSFVLVGGDGSSDKGTLVPEHEEHQEGRLRHHLWRRPPAHHDHGRPAAPPRPPLGLGHLRHADAAELPRALRHEQRDARAARGVHRQGEADARRPGS